MIMHRTTRFLIDKIDSRLGDVRKEIVFDRTMIAVCSGIIAMEIVLLILCDRFPSLFIPTIVGGFFAVACIYLIPVMAKELKDDLKKAKDTEKNGS